MDTLLPSRPSSYYQIIKNSLKLYRSSFLKIFWLSLLVGITAFIPRLLSDFFGQNIFMGMKPLSPYRLWLILLEIIGLTLFIAIIWHMYCVVRKRHEPFIEDISVGIKKVLNVIIAAIIQGLIVAGVIVIFYGVQWLLFRFNLVYNVSPWVVNIVVFVFMLLLALIIYIYTIFIFLIPLIAIENKNAWQALKRSGYLVWNHWWLVFSVQITPWICYVLLLFLIRFIFRVDIHIYLIEQAPHTIWTTILHVIIFTFYVPWVAAILLVQLKDLEIRKHILSQKLK